MRAGIPRSVLKQTPYHRQGKQSFRHRELFIVPPDSLNTPNAATTIARIDTTRKLLNRYRQLRMQFLGKRQCLGEDDACAGGERGK